MSESEELSKNALKKKLKAEEAAKKKAVKDAEKAAKVADLPKKEKLGADDVELDPTQYYENRLRTVKNLGVSSSSVSMPPSFPYLVRRWLPILTNSTPHIPSKILLLNILQSKMVLIFKIP